MKNGIKKILILTLALFCVMGNLDFFNKVDINALEGNPLSPTMNTTITPTVDDKSVYDVNITIDGDTYKTSNTTTTVVPLDVVLVIDNSGSMYGNKMTAAKDGAKQFTNSLFQQYTDVRVSVITYNSTAAVNCVLTSNENQVIAAIEGIAAGGGTYLNDALNMAKAQFATSQPKAEKAIVVLGDGEIADYVNANTTMQTLTATYPDIFVNVIGYELNSYYVPQFQGLTSTAKPGRGNYFDATSNPGSLNNVFDNIITNITTTVQVETYMYETILSTQISGIDVAQYEILPGTLKATKKTASGNSDLLITESKPKIDLNIGELQKGEQVNVTFKIKLNRDAVEANPSESVTISADSKLNYKYDLGDGIKQNAIMKDAGNANYSYASSPLEVIKLDDTEAQNVVVGATFTIKGHRLWNNTLEPINDIKVHSNQDGKLVDENDKIVTLKEGQYTLNEESAPTGYKVNDETFNIVVDASSNLTMSNASKDANGNYIIVDAMHKGKFTIHKIDDSKNGNSVADVEFSLYKKSDNSLIASKTTGADGLVTFDEIAGGSYYLQETKVPNSVILDTTKYEVISDKGNITIAGVNKDAKGNYVIVNNRTKCNLAGQAWVDISRDGKKDANERLAEGVRVSLKDANTGLTASDMNGNLVAPITTDANGNYIFSDLEPGKYTVVFNFENENYEVTKLGDNLATYDSINKEAIIIATVDYSSNLTGALDFGYKPKYEVTKVASVEGGNSDIGSLTKPVAVNGNDTIVYTVKVINKATNDLDIIPNATIEDLIPNGLVDSEIHTNTNVTLKSGLNEFIYTTTVTPIDYPSERVLIKDYVNTASVSVGDEVKVTSNATYHRQTIKQADITIIKVRKDDRNVVLKGAEFTLYEMNTSAVVDKETSDADGKLVFKNVNPGKYKLIETKAPVDHIIENSDFVITVDNDGQAKIVGTGSSENDLNNFMIDNKAIIRTVKGALWVDQNRDGIKDDGERLLSNVEVQLLDKDGKLVKDINGNEVKNIYTDANGNYEFSNLKEGDYKVVSSLDLDNYELSAVKKENGSETVNSNISKIEDKAVYTNIVVKDSSSATDESSVIVDDLDIGIKPNYDISLALIIDGKETVNGEIEINKEYDYVIKVNNYATDVLDTIDATTISSLIPNGMTLVGKNQYDNINLKMGENEFIVKVKVDDMEAGNAKTFINDAEIEVKNENENVTSNQTKHTTKKLAAKTIGVHTGDNTNLNMLMLLISLSSAAIYMVGFKKKSRI